jgi:transposase-like protein
VPPRIPDDRRSAILTDVQSGTKSCRGIARDHGVSDATVRKLAADAGIIDAFSRAQTAKATRAVVEDNRARRARVAAELLDDVDRFRERAWSSYSYYERGQSGPELVTLDKPPLRDAREAYVAIGISLQRHIELEKFDTDRGAEGAKSMLGQLAQAIEEVARSGDAQR